MTTLTQAREAILSKFYDIWSDRTPVVWENLNYDPSGETEWVRINVQSVTGTQASIGIIGSRTYTHTGLITIQVFTKSDIPKTTNDAHCQFALDGFYSGISALSLLNPSIVDIGVDEVWYQQQVVINFEFDDFK